MSFPLPNDHDELDILWADPTGSICLICNMFETFDGETPYMVCFECGHVYRSAQEMLDEYNSFPGSKRYYTAYQIPFCPLCLHDF